MTKIPPMRALIFAAGKGERMRPLTEHTPKPLLLAGGKPLIAWHLEKLAALGVSDIVINTSWLAECFEPVLGDGSRWGLRLHYSFEGAQPLETGGGMQHARRLLGPDPFLAVNGDIWTDFDFARLPREPTGLAHLVMVGNPAQHPRGDFSLDQAGLLHDDDGQPRLTFSGIAVYRPEVLDGWQQVIGPVTGAAESPARFKLAPLLVAAMRRGLATGQLHDGTWTDVGTPERLAQLDRSLQA
jgi:MurNAc alpha-1-phosphate uridylyltransferase